MSAWIGFLLFSFCLFSSAAHSEDLILGVGEKVKIPAHGDLVMGPGKIVRVQDLGSQFQIEGLNPGSTEIKIQKKSYSVSVLREKQFATYRMLKTRQASTWGFNASVDEGEVILGGKLLFLDEWKKIASGCTSGSCQYQSRFEVPPHLRPLVQRHFAQLFQSLNYGTFQMRWAPELQILLPARRKISNEIRKISSAYGLTVVADEKAIELEPSIRVKILILELKKHEMNKYGIQWSPSYTATILNGASSPADGFFATAHFFEQNGVGRVLANPSLLCRSGKESEFLAGGELPIKLLNFKTSDVVWKKYGVLLKVKPKADFSGRMSIGIETEISSIDDAHRVDGIPGFFTNRVKSHFDLAESRTIVLSGLIKHEQGQSRDGIIGLTNLPVIGPLFSSPDFKNDESEMVILVRPELVTTQEAEVST